MAFEQRWEGGQEASRADRCPEEMHSERGGDGCAETRVGVRLPSWSSKASGLQGSMAEKGQRESKWGEGYLSRARGLCEGFGFAWE